MEFSDENPIVTRLKQYIDNSGLCTTQFADRAGIPRPTFSQLLSGRNKTINNQILAKLNENFPDLDILWLLFGRTGGGAKENFKTSEPLNRAEYHSEPTGSTDSKEDTVSKYRFETAPDVSENSRNPRDAAADSLFGNVVKDEPYVEYGAPRRKSVTVHSVRKAIKQIVIFYTDNSFEIYDPS